MVSDGPERFPSRRQLVALAGWLAAAAVYIGIGVYEVDFLLSYWVALAYVLVVSWLVPATARRVAKRLRPNHRSTEGRPVA
jgi:hypothetical protein